MGVGGAIPDLPGPRVPSLAVTSLKVLTVNTHKGFTHFNRRFILPELRDAVRLVGADVVFLQEVHGAQSQHAQRVPNWPARPQYEFLADSLWTDFAYGRNAVYPHGDHGNAVLSKFPIVRHQNLDVSVGRAENRGLLHCVLQLPGPIELHAICVHLGLREAERQRQLTLLCQLLARLPAAAPVVVAGDFNDWRQRATAVLQDAAGLHEVFARAQGATAKSYPAIWPALRLDRIYARNVLTSAPQVLSRRPWSHLSDHVPLAVQVSF
jgi:endonuclease/exonuclease/phosphatase family metal-dependent hydrolase